MKFPKMIVRSTKLFTPVSLVLAGASTLLAAGGVGLQPGKYQVKTIMEMNGQQMPSEGKRCLTNADLADPEAVFNERIFAKYKPDATCTQRNLKNSGGKISYDEDCTNRTVHVDASVSGTSYSAVRSVTPKSSRAQGFTYKITGQRIGACTK